MNEQTHHHDDAQPRHTWNYRLIHHNDEPPDRQWIGLHEVHYNGDDITGWTIDSASFGCDIDEGPDGVIKSLEMALKDARDRPMLLMTALKERMKQLHHQELEVGQVADEILSENDDESELLQVLSDASDAVRADERQKIATFVRHYPWAFPLFDTADIEVADDVLSKLCNQLADAILTMTATDDANEY